MNAEVARRRPAIILEARELSRVVDVRAIERRKEVAPLAKRGTPADWPARVWVPLLLSPALLAWLLLLLVL